MARPRVPQFGNWEGNDNVPYTVYFEKARQGRSTGKMMNPNDPQENPELFAKMAAQAQPKAPLPKLIPEPEPIVRAPVRPRANHDRKSSRENGEFKQFHESPGRRENVGGRINAQGGGRGTNYSARPVRQSIGSENSIERSPLHIHHQAKVAGKTGNSSPAWDGKSSYDSSHGTPDRSRMRPAQRSYDSPARGAAVPKFGDWDENKPSSGDGYTQIFNKVREERHTGAAKSPNNNYEPTPAPRQKYHDDDMKACCFPWGRK